MNKGQQTLYDAVQDAYVTAVSSGEVGDIEADLLIVKAILDLIFENWPGHEQDLRSTGAARERRAE